MRPFAKVSDFVHSALGKKPHRSVPFSIRARGGTRMNFFILKICVDLCSSSEFCLGQSFRQALHFGWRTRPASAERAAILSLGKQQLCTTRTPKDRYPIAADGRQ